MLRIMSLITKLKMYEEVLVIILQYDVLKPSFIGETAFTFNTNILLYFNVSRYV